jgi:hypothetical protein
MALDSHGVLAAVTIAMYVPFLLLSIKIVSKYGIARGDGWVFLLIFCISKPFGLIEDIMLMLTLLYL